MISKNLAQQLRRKCAELANLWRDHHVSVPNWAESADCSGNNGKAVTTDYGTSGLD